MGKLMKHELKANSRIMLPAFLLAALLSVLGGLSARFLDAVQNSVLLQIISVMFIALFVIVTVFLALLCFVYMVQRFYATMAGREAYLTLNLPLSMDEHICSKLLTSLIWSILTALVTAAAIAIFILVSGGAGPFKALSGGYRDFKAQIAALGMTNKFTLFVFESIIMIIIQLLASYLLVYASVAIGQKSSEKKLGSTIGAFAGLSVITSMVGNLVTTLFVKSASAYDWAFNYGSEFAEFTDFIRLANSVFLYGIAFGILQCVVYYFVSSRLLKTKLNLN